MILLIPDQFYVIIFILKNKDDNIHECIVWQERQANINNAKL